MHRVESVVENDQNVVFTVQMIAGLAIMVQSYLVLEEDNKRLNSRSEVFDWLVKVLSSAISADSATQNDLVYDDIEVLQVRWICGPVVKLCEDIC